MEPERQCKSGMDGGLPAAVRISPLLHLKTDEILSNRWGPPHRDVILDPFAGAGSTLLACENLGRSACLVEIMPRYVDCIIMRWQKYTNRLAHLSGTNKSFDEVAHERKSSTDNGGGKQ